MCKVIYIHFLRSVGIVFSHGKAAIDKEQTKPLFWMLVLHGLNEGFIPLYRPAQFPACTAIVALSTGALHWLAYCPAALLCTLSPERNLSPEQRRSAGYGHVKETQKQKEEEVNHVGCQAAQSARRWWRNIWNFKNLRWCVLITWLLVMLRVPASHRDVQFYSSGLYYSEDSFFFNITMHEQMFEEWPLATHG